MEELFEAKYIAIKWIDRDTVSSIEEANIAIEIKTLDLSNCSIDIQTYKRIENGFDGQIAFHFLDNKSDSKPYFTNAQSNTIPLLKIKNPLNNKEWWIEDGNWSQQYRRRLSELWNHVGETTVFLGNIRCLVNISAISFTKEQLDLYLQDFKNDFWYLILKRDSLAQVNIENNNEANQVKILNDDTIEKLSRFIGYIQNILKNPKKELREIQGLKDIKQVRPVPRTFMEIASGGFKKKLTSRDNKESYNVAENKYIHFTLQQVYLLVFNMLLASKHINSFYQNKAQAESKRLNSFSNTKIINKEVFNNQLEDLKHQLETINENLKNAITSQDENELIVLNAKMNSSLDVQITRAIQSQGNLDLNNQDIQIFHIKLENKQADYRDRRQFYGKIKIKDAETWDGEIDKDSYSLEFDASIFEFLDGNQEFYIKAKTEYEPRQTKNNRTLHKIFFCNIIELIPLNRNNNNELTFQTIFVSLGSKSEYFNDKIQFWGKARLENQENWYQFPEGDFLSLEFDKSSFDGCLQEQTEYKITAYYDKSSNPKKGQENEEGRKKLIHKRTFKYITQIEQVSISALEKQIKNNENQKTKLEAEDWKRALTPDEINKQNQEKEAIRQQIELLNEDSNVTSEYSKHLEPMIFTLKQLLRQFSKLSISQSSYFPNSMTFVQNPHYQGTYKYYELIKGIVGIDESLFIQMQIAEKIGVLDLPILYERWCLLQIIKVLIDKYRYIPEKDWKVKLASQVLANPNNIRNVSIEFLNENAERKISFGYEKEFSPKGKRPDFTLDIKSLRNSNEHKLIMDAKFHEDVEIDALINELYPPLDESNITELDKKCPRDRHGNIQKKNYSQNSKNTVFILHPDATNPIKKQLTDTDWGTKSYYGEVDMFHYEWDKNKKPNHKYGAILLSPIEEKGQYLDSLQRLIGLGLQYNLESNQLTTRPLDPKPK
ncbi:MAG: nuclease domain-containing protein, partial [Sulfurimonas sp.]|nr:nuclease domain-containing protein [Sulfurimonas sp.]